MILTQSTRITDPKQRLLFFIKWGRCVVKEWSVPCQGCPLLSICTQKIMSPFLENKELRGEALALYIKSYGQDTDLFNILI